MNDTTRDDLVADVQKAISDTFDMANEYRYNDTSGGAQGGVNILAKALSADIVRMVTAARDAEIQELLLSEEAVEAGERVLIRDEWANANRAKSMNVIESAIIAIGLGDSEVPGWKEARNDHE